MENKRDMSTIKKNANEMERGEKNHMHKELLQELVNSLKEPEAEHLYYFIVGIKGKVY